LGMLSAFISLLTGSQWEHAAVSSVVPLVVSPEMPFGFFSP
jgi:hypothetical protein